MLANDRERFKQTVNFPEKDLKTFLVQYHLNLGPSQFRTVSTGVSKRRWPQSSSEDVGIGLAMYLDSDGIIKTALLWTPEGNGREERPKSLGGRQWKPK